MMTEGNTSTRSSSRANGGTARGTVKVRNVAEGVVYHLTFDGDLGRLTGGQLKQHIESIAGIPAARQQLSVGGHMMADASLASSFGVRDGTVIMMDMVSDAAATTTTAPASEAGGDRHSEAPAAKSTTNSPPPETQEQEQQPREERRPPPPKSRPVDDQPADQHHDADAADPESELRRIEAEIAEIKRRERDLARRHHEVKEQSTRRERGQSVVHHYHTGSADGSHYQQHYASQPRRQNNHHQHQHSSSASSVPKGRAPARGVVDSDGDEHVEIEVEVEEEPGLTAAWLPSRSVDIDEMRLQQQDYVWKMEQVRFETERMTREREMRRQQQELEYQAALLDRERVEMERKTTMERAEFEDIQARERDDVDIEARYTPMLAYHGSTASAPHMHSAHVTSSGLLP